MIKIMHLKLMAIHLEDLELGDQFLVLDLEVSSIWILLCFCQEDNPEVQEQLLMSLIHHLHLLNLEWVIGQEEWDLHLVKYLICQV
jgi:hypothetical protein